MALAAVDAELGGILKTTEKFDALNAYWRDLKTKLPITSTRTSEDLHATLIANIRGLIALVGDTSNLILDPDLDSYCTMDAVLLKLPENRNLLKRTQLLMVPSFRWSWRSARCAWATGTATSASRTI